MITPERKGGCLGTGQKSRLPMLPPLTPQDRGTVLQTGRGDSLCPGLGLLQHDPGGCVGDTRTLWVFKALLFNTNGPLQPTFPLVTGQCGGTAFSWVSLCPGTDGHPLCKRGPRLAFLLASMFTGSEDSHTTTSFPGCSDYGLKVHEETWSGEELVYTFVMQQLKQRL